MAITGAAHGQEWAVILYMVGCMTSFVLRRLPLGFGYAVAHLLAHIAFRVWPRGRVCLRENVSHVLGDGADRGEIDEVAKRTFRNYFKYLVDFVRMSTAQPSKDAMARLAFQDIDNLGKALEGGTGGILVGLHQGNWELTGDAVVKHGYPLNVVVDSFASARLDEFVQGRRRGGGMKVIAMEDGVGEMLDVLRRNELLVLLIDIPGAGKGVDVRFCDALTQMPRGAATLALKTGARIVPIASVRLADNTFLCYADEPIRFQASGHLGKDAQALTQMVMESLERYVRRHPDQSYMFRRMWPRDGVTGDPPVS